MRPVRLLHACLTRAHVSGLKPRTKFVLCTVPHRVIHVSLRLQACATSDWQSARLAFKQFEMSHDRQRGFLKAGCVFALMSCSYLD